MRIVDRPAVYFKTHAMDAVYPFGCKGGMEGVNADAMLRKRSEQALAQLGREILYRLCRQHFTQGDEAIEIEGYECYIIEVIFRTYRIDGTLYAFLLKASLELEEAMLTVAMSDAEVFLELRNTEVASLVAVEVLEP